MKLSKTILSRFTDLPDATAHVRDLLDDVGVEVKRTEETDKDVIFTVELLANRGDHYCYAGVAREVSGRTGAHVLLPKSMHLSTGDSPVPLSIQTPLCSRYSITELVRTTEAGSVDADAIAVLEAAGLHSVSAPVDATNVANAEIGQPTHAFDADTIEGAITVRTSTAGERAWLLFTEGPVDLAEGTLVVADDVKILAVAGVIGCEESKSTESTTRVFLESAAFDPVAVRKGARSLSIHTDSSARFERGSDASLVLPGAGRVAELMASAGWRVQGTTGLVGDWVDERRTVLLNIALASTFLQVDLTAADIVDRLSRYGFSSERAGEGLLSVRVPPHRVWDVAFAADLYEELAKSIGYNNTPEELPTVSIGSVPSLLERNTVAVEEVLLAAGFYEVYTDGFHGRDLQERAGVADEHPLFAHVETENALDRGYSLLKNNGLYQAVDGIATNLRMRTDQVKMYEWTRTFHLQDDGSCTERHLLWGICTGSATTPSWDGKPRPADGFFVKALIDTIARSLSLPLTVGPADTTAPLSSLLHPHRQAAIFLDGRAVGLLGEVHPTVLRGNKVKRARPVYFELDTAVLEQVARTSAYVEPSAHQPILRSLAFPLPLRTTAGAIAQHLQSTGPDWLISVRIVDNFALDDGRAVTFALSYESANSTRSADAVNAAMEAMIQAVVTRFGDLGVSLRG